jgi:regulator of protease activity HflC (stomatin/prohibitin superfamily)
MSDIDEMIAALQTLPDHILAAIAVLREQKAIIDGAGTSDLGEYSNCRTHGNKLYTYCLACRAERAEAERDAARAEAEALRKDAERNAAIAKLAQRIASELIREAQRTGDAMFVIFANARGKQYNEDLAAIDAAKESTP